MKLLHQSILSLLAIILLLVPKHDAIAERKPVKILDLSTSGRTVMISAGSRDGLKLKEAMLIRRENKKLAAARVIRLFAEKAAVYIVARYSREQPQKTRDNRRFNILYGIPLAGIPQLPSGIADEIEDDLERNPQDEQYLTEEGREHEPEIDDEEYTPEVTVRPEFPPVEYRRTHNISIGLGLFRNANLSSTLNPDFPNAEATTTYTGMFARYTYNFYAFYWLKKKVKALVSVEASVGVYNFPFTDFTTLADGQKTEVEVIPLGVYVRYNFEFSPLFMAYPYVGYQLNIATATNNFPDARLDDLRGGGIAFGIGSSLVMSRVIDIRLDAGNDGVFVGTVVKF